MVGGAGQEEAGEVGVVVEVGEVGVAVQVEVEGVEAECEWIQIAV